MIPTNRNWFLVELNNTFQDKEFVAARNTLFGMVSDGPSFDPRRADLVYCIWWTMRRFDAQNRRSAQQ